MFLGFANLFGISFFAQFVFIPIQSLGVLSLIMSRVLMNDVMRFVLLFVYILANFYGITVVAAHLSSRRTNILLGSTEMGLGQLSELCLIRGRHPRHLIYPSP
eukprot:4605594-Prymnesium_polylepis.1